MLSDPDNSPAASAEHAINNTVSMLIPTEFDVLRHLGSAS
jgi:hypothetical protein